LLGADEHPVSRALRGEQVPPLEVSVTDAQGETRYLMLQVTVVREGPGIQTGAVLIEHDITEAKRAQGRRERMLVFERHGHAVTSLERDRLHQILEVLPEGVIIYDAGTRVTTMNRAAEALLGISVLGRTRADFDLQARRLDGTPVPWHDVPVLTSSVALRGAGGAITGAVSVMQDMSAIKHLEQQRDRMLVTVTHDLRNPLTSITGISQILQILQLRSALG
jgi:PAS domain-containing protein